MKIEIKQYYEKEKLLKEDINYNFVSVDHDLFS
jgi:hypothetical protein